MVSRDFDVAVTYTDSSEMKATITVIIADDEPTISVTPSEATVNSGGTVNGTWGYSFGADCPDSPSVTIGSASDTDASLPISLGQSVTVTGTYGTLTVYASGNYSYTAGDATGEDSFTFEITDGDGDVATATLTITISATAEP